VAGEPLAEAVGQELEEFVVVLTRAPPLPGGLGREHLPDHLHVVAPLPNSRFAIVLPSPVGGYDC